MRSQSNSRSEPVRHSLWRRLVSALVNLPVAPRVLWILLLIAGLFLLEFFGDLKHPNQTPWFNDIATNQRHSFKTFLYVGLWYGTLIHLILIACLLATVRWWGRLRPATYSVSLGNYRSQYNTAFWVLLAMICIVAGIIRWPKMSLSYWGDEGWAVAPYVYGKHVPVDPENAQGALKHKPVGSTPPLMTEPAAITTSSALSNVPPWPHGAGSKACPMTRSTKPFPDYPLSPLGLDH